LLAYPQSETQASDPKQQRQLPSSYWSMPINSLGIYYITTQGGDYIFSLKGNQGNLQADVHLYMKDQEVIETMTSHTRHDKGHGRLETRTCWVTPHVDWLKERHPKWHTISSLICIESIRETKDKTTKETRYYISSRYDPPEKTLQAVRSHWAIENKLHWVLDMSLGEDQSRIRKHNAPQIMAIIRHIALNLLNSKKKSTPRQSIRRLRKMASWSDDILSSILSQNFS
jgi:predicted transposase YbfD/YdcC